MTLEEMENKAALNNNLREAVRLAAKLLDKPMYQIIEEALAVGKSSGYNWMNKQREFSLEKCIKLLKYLITETELTEEELVDGMARGVMRSAQ